jgi:tetratricopeptide repeat protein 8
MAGSILKSRARCSATHAKSASSPGPWLEQRQNEIEKAKLHYKDAARVAPHIHEPHYNFALLAYKAGDIHTAYNEARTFDLQPL